MYARSMPTRTVVATLAIGALLLAACGGSSTSGDPGAGTSAGQGGGSFQAGGPLKVAFMWEVKGESANAIDDYANGAALAIEELNAAGGVGGRPVETVRFPSSPTDPQALQVSFLKAVDAQPSAIVGFPGLTIESVAGQFDRHEVPVVGVTTADKLKFGGELGSRWYFQANPAGTSDTATAVRYTTEALKSSSVGVMHTNEVYGQTGSAAIVAGLEGKGVEVTANESYTPATLDLTNQVLAMKGADSAINWGFPNNIAVQMNQFQQNGIDIPSISGPGAVIAVVNGLVKSPAVDKLHGINACNMAQGANPRSQAFIDAYKARYGQSASPTAAMAHDAVLIVAAAAERARSVEPGAIRDALAEVKVTNGVCATDYHADGAQVMNHQTVVLSFVGGGQKTVASYTFPDEAAVRR